SNTLLLFILAVISVGAAGFALVPSMLGDSRAQKRRKALQGDMRVNRRETENSRVRDQRRKSVQQALKAQNDEIAAKRRATLPDLLFQAARTITPAVYIRNSLLLGGGLFLFLLIVRVPFFYAAILATAGGYVLPRMYVGRRRKKYQNAFLDELPNA